MNEKIVGKIYLKSDPSCNWDVYKYNEELFVKFSEEVFLSKSLLNNRYFDFYEDIK